MSPRGPSPWGPLAEAPRLIAERENRVFRATLADGRTIALREHRAGYQSAAGIAQELRWTAALAAAGFPCPAPVPTLDGRLTDPGPPLRSAVTWLDGTPIADFELKGTARFDLYRDLGTLLAHLHETSDAVHDPAPCTRAFWHADGLTGPDPLWGRYWENPAADDETARALQSARDTLRDWLAAQPALDIGPIHADPLGENVLRTETGLALIDFDDAGHGYRLHDPGVALLPLWEDRALPDLTAAMAEGYADRRGLNRGTVAEALPRFTALRALASAGWIITRAGPTDARHGQYLRRALTAARAAL